MTGPPAATAAVRSALRRCLSDQPAHAPVFAAVSGGADSLALAAALAFERPGTGALVVDHGLQPGSAAVATRAAAQCTDLGLIAQVLGPAPGTEPGPGGHATGARGPGRPGGPEAAARARRYALLAAAAGGAPILLGHTLDDQAETVLLGLARGAGARALAGMAPVRGALRRPLLALTRDTTRAACLQAGLTPYEDPHNTDPAYARVRVRTQVLPVLEQALGPGVAEALARTARHLREDADALDQLAAPTPVGEELDVKDLTGLLPAVRARVLKRWAERVCGQPVGAAHVDALRALVEAWTGQGPVGLPGGTQAGRRGGALVAVSPDCPPDTALDAPPDAPALGADH